MSEPPMKFQSGYYTLSDKKLFDFESNAVIRTLVMMRVACTQSLTRDSRKARKAHIAIKCISVSMSL
jgi:hypothetical protein